jgi:hypothetical protein
VGGREGDLTPRLKHIEVERSLVTRGARNGYLLTAPLVAVVTLLVVAPLAVFLVYSFLSPIPFGVEPTFTLANYRTVVQEGIWWRLIRNSIQIGVTTAAVSVLLGLVLGYYLSFHAGRWKYLLLGATAVSILGGYLVRVFGHPGRLGQGERLAVVGSDDGVTAPRRARSAFCVDVVPGPVRDVRPAALGWVGRHDPTEAQLRTVVRALEHQGGCGIALGRVGARRGCRVLVTASGSDQGDGR